MTKKNNEIYFGENLPILKTIATNSIALIYIDPPFNTGKNQTRTQIRTERSKNGDRIGYNGNTYQTIKVGTKSYIDKFDDYIDDFLKPRLQEAKRILRPNGSLYFHIDYREVHRCKMLLDKIFDDGDFLGEIIWAYDYGGRSKKKWPAKHDNILVYTKSDKGNHIFNTEYANQIEYKAPTYDGQVVCIPPTTTWWHTIVPTNGTERTGYPTQKPLGIIDRIILASSHPNDTVLDFFAGSGTTGASCLVHNRRFILIDNNPEANKVMKDRFSKETDIEWFDLSQ